MANSKKCEICDVHFDGHTKSVMYQDEDGEVTFYCSSCYEEDYNEIHQKELGEI